MGHVGFMLIGLAFFSIEGASATFHYIFIYILSSFVMWFIVLYIGKDKINIISFKQLKNSNIIVGLIFAFLIFSMSGIPPLAGFFAKLDILFVLLENFKFYLNYIIFFFTVASFFYYLRIIKIIFFENDNTFLKNINKSYERMLMIVFIILFLFFYILIVQNSILVLQKEILSVIYK